MHGPMNVKFIFTRIWGICFRRHERCLCRMAHNQELVISNSCVNNPQGSQKIQNASASGPLHAAL